MCETKSSGENQNTHFMFSDPPHPFPKIVPLRNSRAGQATDDKIIRRMRIACWIPKATNTHSQYVTLIAFPLQQLLHERASMLRYTYNCLFCYCSGLLPATCGLRLRCIEFCQKGLTIET